MRASVAAVAIGAIVFFVAYHLAGERDRVLGTAAAPIVVVLSREHGARATPADLVALDVFLEAHTGLVFEVQVAPSAVDAIQSFGDARADVGLLKLFEYLLAHAEYGVEARLRVLRAGGAPDYTGEIVVRAGAPIRTLADLAGKKIAYTDRFSTSGFVFAAKLLADANVRPAVEMAGGHPEALARLKAGHVDAAATYAGACAADPALRVVATTAPIPGEPVFFRRHVNGAVKDRVAAALVAFASTPEGRRVLSDMAGVAGFEPATDASYDPVLAAIQAIDSHVADLVPEGRTIWESNRRAIDLR